MKNNKVRILVLDIETAPLEVYTWGIHQQVLYHQQIKKDWSVLSWAACWLDEPNKVMYADTRGQKDPRDDKRILKQIRELMDEADFILGQNSNSFDIKRLNTRFLVNGIEAPSSYKKIDTRRIAKKHFAFTSTSLDFLTKKLNSRQEKMKNSGLSLWIRCLNGDLKAFKELEKYNKQDVVATAALYKEYLQPWDDTTNISVYTDDHVCNCGSTELKKQGFAYTASGKFQRYKCKSCGSEFRDKKNLFTKEKLASLKVRVK